ncbi:MFS transporter [Streptomyces sp. NPDC016562]|uniref:MFS transporter n=1 Tax=Streptomyces sp. NPDC016562 TaxID=3364966 RepID=UPI0036FC7B8B
MSSTATTTSTAPPGDQQRRPGLVLFMVCVAIFMLMLDATVVSAALADIRKDFDASADGLQWVIDAYSIPLAGVLLTFATLGDRFGRRRMFIIGMAGFTASSLALAFANTIVVLDVLRAAQGFAAAMLFATALPLLSVAYPEKAARAKAIGIYGAVMALATVAGPVVGGALVTQFGWRSIFTINVPIGIGIMVLAWLKMPESASSPERRADLLGSVLLTGGLVAGVFALTRSNALGWTSGTVIGLLVAAVILLIAFLAWQVKAKHPLFDLGMAKKPGFSGTAIVSVAHMATLMAASNYIALFLIGTLGYSPLQMGLRLLPISLGAMIAAPLTAIFARRVPLALSLPVTMALVTVGMYLMGNFGHDSEWTHFVPGMLIGGLGLGAITAVTQAASLTFASQENAGMASATFGTLRQIGMAMGIAGLGAMFSRVAEDKTETGLAAIPGVDAVPSDLKEQFIEGIGSGAGHQVVEGVPAQFADSVPALTQVADSASIDAMNALANLGAVIGAVAVVLAVITFAIDSRRSGKVNETTREPEPASV